MSEQYIRLDNVFVFSQENYPFMLLAPEDLVTCSFIWQAALILDKTTRFGGRVAINVAHAALEGGR